MKRFIPLLLALNLAAGCLGFVGCGKTKYEPNTLVIFKEYNGVAGSEDDAVRAEIERKFQADTGKELHLVLETAGEQLAQKAANALGTNGERIDAFINHYASDSPILSYLRNDQCKDLTDMVDRYAPDFKARFSAETDPGALAWNSGVYEDKLVALSSIEHTSNWGMIVRKDYMANTDYDPDDYDVAKPGYKSLTIDQFKDLLLQLQSENAACERVIAARPWNLDEMISPVFGAVKYINNDLDGEGNVVPAYATDGYRKVLEFERWLQENKLWTEDPANNKTIDQYFMSGKAAILLNWSEVTAQIKNANLLKEAAGADCIMLAPLLKEGSETETNGNLRQPRAFLGMAVPKKGENTELLLEYLNWTYASKENYELCRYGIKGQHWVEAELAGLSMYDYPADKKAMYAKVAPYSGNFCLLTDVTMSDRSFAQCTEAQAEWIKQVHSFPSFPARGYVDEGVVLPAVPRTDANLRKKEQALGRVYTQMRGYAWSDAPFPSGKSSVSDMWNDMVTSVYSADSYLSYIEFLTDNYNRIIESRK